jgi:putative DNA primase/helicase
MNSQDSTLAPATQGFEAIASFIREYLVCDDHQLNILTLWLAYTWCFGSLRDVAYLDIRSPQPQSGKSVCLKLLAFLANAPTLVTAATPDTLKNRLLHGRSVNELKKTIEAAEKTNQENQRWVAQTFLIDDFHYSFGSSERQALVAILNCGSDITSMYSHGHDDYLVVAPKAFAGNLPLPESLASRCIPIILRRNKFSEPVRRFFPEDLMPLISTLAKWLEQWSASVRPRLAENHNKPIQLPPALTPRQQQCAEPLLRIANLVGGPWPAMARDALSAVFGCCQYNEQVQILRDIRDLFLQKDQPEKLPTQDVLSYLRGLENRPWSTWGPRSGNRLSNLLRPFGIFSSDMKVEGDSVKGYRFENFQDAWERYAGPVATGRDLKNAAATT